MNKEKIGGWISHGDDYQTNQKLYAQENVDIGNLKSITDANLPQTMKSITSTVQTYISDKNIDDYWLLQLQANYFSNIFDVECEKYDVYLEIKKMIRTAFIDGKAGLYKVGDKWVAVRVSYIDGEMWVSRVNDFTNDSFKKDWKPNLKVDVTDSLHIYNWSSYGWNAWVYFYPFIKSQNVLLKMLLIQSFAYNKKYVYNVLSKNMVPDEMKNFFDPLNPFLINLGDDGLTNLFQTIEQGGNNVARDFIQYYKEYTDQWYQLFGRRSNVDNKKERNISVEVNASQDSIDILQQEPIRLFELWAKEFSESSGIRVGIIKRESLQDNWEEQEGDNKNANIRND